VILGIVALLLVVEAARRIRWSMVILVGVLLYAATPICARILAVVVPGSPFSHPVYFQ
jgi:EamA domain-containing membrane protein RarD